MKNLLLTLLLAITTLTSYCQTYNMASGSSISTCSGTFYDPQGTGDYLDFSGTISRTFCSDNGNSIIFTFSSFETREAADNLVIYQGADNTGTVIGTYSGTTAPTTITSTGTCLTFEWTTDGNQAARLGWEAAISCALTPFDECGSPIAIAVPTSCTTTAYNLSTLPNTWSGITTSTCYNAGTHVNATDGWYSFTATSTTTEIDITDYASDAGYIAVFSGSCGSLTEVSCGDGASLDISLSVPTAIGTDYLVQVVGNNATANGNICVYGTPPVGGYSETCGNPIPLTVGATCGTPTAFDTDSKDWSGVTDGTCYTAATFYGPQDMWFTFTATSDSTIIEAPTNNPSFDETVIAVYTSGCGSLTDVACRRNYGGTSLDLNVSTTNGTQYWVQIIADYGRTDGTICAYAYTPPAQLPGEHCTSADTLTVGTGCNATGFDHTSGTPPNWSGIEDAACIATGIVDVDFFNPIDSWYTFIATSDSTTIETAYTTANGYAIGIAIFTSTTDCSALTEEACEISTTGGSATIITTIGQQYWVQIVENLVSGSGDASGNICVYETPESTPNTNTDCATATPICGNAAFGGNSGGPGSDDLDATTAGCLLSEENQSSWYKFRILTGGSLEFLITPTNGEDDYDFALYQADSTCNDLGAPLRCSYKSFTTGDSNGPDTGLEAGAGDDSENSGSTLTPHLVNNITTLVGEEYYLLVDNHSSTTSPFTLNWGGTTVLDCAVLPIQLADLNVKNLNGNNIITWSTSTEINNDYFIVKRSTDALTWNEINRSIGAGNSTIKNNYSITDNSYSQTTNYYKLFQVDFNGKETPLKTITINNNSQHKKVIEILNILGAPVDQNYKGVKIYKYSDGSIEKKVSY